MIQNNTIARHEFEMFRVILNDSKLIRNAQYTSESFKVNIDRVRAIFEEYNITGCVIVNSKINYGKH
jgi:hypothetical protein